MENQHKGRLSLNRRQAPQQSPMDTFAPMDCGTESPVADDPFSLSALLSLDNYPELCSPSAGSQLFSPFTYAGSPVNYSSFQPVATNWASSLVSPNASPDIEALVGAAHAHKSSIQPGFLPTSPPQMFGSRNSASASDEKASNTAVIPKPISGVSLEERMLRALSVFKDSSGGGILAQVWMPVRHGNGLMLSTSEQPFLLDQMLAGYREVSRTFTFSAAETPGLFPGLPGRVFISEMPEWTSNVLYYNKFEYLRADYAVNHEVRGSLAMPIFDPNLKSCCAVLELVTTREKPNFDMEMESVCKALQAVDLKTVKPRVHLQNLTKNQKSAFSEILDVLRACCHAHMLPLALTWVPFSCDGDKAPDSVRDVILEMNSSFRKKNLLCIQESACYINDAQMKGFLHACSEHCLEKGQGIAGKALKSNHPFFSPDVKSYDILEYPFAHHARKYGLQAAVAIRLRSTYTGSNDYILEFFLPVNCKGSLEQQELLNSLSSTMQRICRSLRTVSEAELAGMDPSKLDVQKQARTSLSPCEISVNNSQTLDTSNEDLSSGDPKVGVLYPEQCNSDFTSQTEKKRSTSDKNINLGVLQQYFSGSLKDAAKSIGVCPTTLKRICRQHGISRWPSRKINKVNRSLKKIQTVINSVQGVEGAIKYDTESGCLVAAVSSLEKSTSSGSRGITFLSSTTEIETERFIGKIEPPSDNISKSSYQRNFRATGCKSGLPVDNITSKSSNSNATDDMKTDVDTKEHTHPSDMTDSSSGSASSCQTFRKCLKAYPVLADTGPSITVKASYKEDIVRFKYSPSSGCHQLFEEISMRYKLQIGTFQLKYMDDEEEWVMLANESDLQECIEVLESVGSGNVKLLVRDIPCIIGSSGASNCY